MKTSLCKRREFIYPAMIAVSLRKSTLSSLEQMFIALRFHTTGKLEIINDDFNVH